MRDPRVHEYARLLVDRCVGVQPGWEVLVRATPLARPLVEAVTEEIARRGAYPFIQLAWARRLMYRDYPRDLSPSRARR